jgi:FtsH-binding integral membrane protein
VCSVYDPETVALAAFLTLLITLGLTIFALKTTADFTFANASIFVFSIVLVTCTLLAIFLPNNYLLRLIISGVSVIIFGLYLIYDIQAIAGSHYVEFTLDDYVIAALQVYLDIIMLFLHLLRIVGKK